MLSFPPSPSVRIFIAREPIDMRKGLDGLSGMVIEVIDEDPQSGHLFVFFNRRRDRMKSLVWDGSGLLRQFIMSIPRDLDEAAIIDGAGPFRVLWQVLVPLMKPALSTVAILQFLGDWNDFFGPFIYLNTMVKYTAAVGLRTFQAMPLEVTDPRDHLLMAGAAIMTLPVLVVFAIAQRYFVSGVVMSGLKL